MTRLRRSIPSLMAVVLCASTASAIAAEYQSVGNEPAVLFDAPTLRGTRTAIAPRGMPLEIIVAQGDWARVRDSQGGLAWVEKKALVAKRTVVATDPGPLDVHASPDDAAPVVFRVQHGVLMDLAAPPSGGWVSVRHRDGQAGFVRVGSVWGE
jgi:SH3-like domain-containing protein